MRATLGGRLVCLGFFLIANGTTNQPRHLLNGWTQRAGFASYVSHNPTAVIPQRIV
jgi:hypothetical protein